MNQELQIQLLVDYPCDCGDCHECNDTSYLFIPCEWCGKDKHDDCVCYG